MIPMTFEEANALGSLLDYMWKDEQGDYIDHPEEHGKNCHMFEEMVKLDNYLRRRLGHKALTAADHIKDE